jgi:hypothetical protein
MTKMFPCAVQILADVPPAAQAAAPPAAPAAAAAAPAAPGAPSGAAQLPDKPIAAAATPAQPLTAAQKEKKFLASKKYKAFLEADKALEADRNKELKALPPKPPPSSPAGGAERKSRAVAGVATMQSLGQQPASAAAKAKALAELQSFFKKAGKPFKKADEALEAGGDELVGEIQSGDELANDVPSAHAAVAAKVATQSLERTRQERGSFHVHLFFRGARQRRRPQRPAAMFGIAGGPIRPLAPFYPGGL